MQRLAQPLGNLSSPWNWHLYGLGTGSANVDRNERHSYVFGRAAMPHIPCSWRTFIVSEEPRRRRQTVQERELTAEVGHTGLQV